MPEIQGPSSTAQLPGACTHGQPPCPDCHCKVTQATGTGERDAAQEMAADRPGANQKTIGADKNYDTRGFVAEMRRIAVTPHVAQNTSRPGGSGASRQVV